jgi:hypothetical protein
MYIRCVGQCVEGCASNLGQMAQKTRKFEPFDYGDFSNAD